MVAKRQQQQEAASLEQEVLPPGVGRVPKWWLEITPHYTLDLEEDEARRVAEAQMSMYYAQMAAADDAGLLGPDGKPRLGPDGKPLAWHGGSGWAGRAAPGGSGANGAGGPGGRNFSVGPYKIDPKMFGIDESHPDYQAYLTGAKLPPGYLEKMAELYGPAPVGLANNLQQTDYGRYGRQAEKPAFQPSWAKMKLRSSRQGQSIRQGQYDDSPNKFVRRNPLALEEEDTAAMAAPSLDDVAPPESAPVAPPALPEKEEEARPVAPTQRSFRASRPIEAAPPAPRANQPATSSSEPTTDSNYKKYSYKDFYYNATPSASAAPSKGATEPTKTMAAPESYQPPSRSAAQEAAPAPEEDEVVEEEEYYEEEIVEEEEDPTPGAAPPAGDDLSDLQALLAAKQAELARLRAQL